MTYPIVTELRKKNEICRNKINSFDKIQNNLSRNCVSFQS